MKKLVLMSIILFSFGTFENNVLAEDYLYHQISAYDDDWDTGEDEPGSVVVGSSSATYSPNDAYGIAKVRIWSRDESVIHHLDPDGSGDLYVPLGISPTNIKVGFKSIDSSHSQYFSIDNWAPQDSSNSDTLH